jgi:peroxiredoxin Q/BCP
MRLKALVMISMLSLLGLTARAVKPGDAAPDFSSKATGGKTVQLSDFKGKWLALYFYPKANTPGCTKESCSLRDGFADLKALGVEVVGVSVDDVVDQEDFKKQQNLPFPLLADTSKEVTKAYDNLSGFGVASRRTFLIDPAGKVAFVFDKVDTGKHAAQILEKVKELKKP